jgi:hypothetical protein
MTRKPFRITVSNKLLKPLQTMRAMPGPMKSVKVIYRLYDGKGNYCYSDQEFFLDKTQARMLLRSLGRIFDVKTGPKS